MWVILSVILGTAPPDLTEKVLRGFIRGSPRGEACRASGQHGPWDSKPSVGNTVGANALATLRKLEERKDAGRALSPEEEARLLEAIPTLRSVLIGTFVRVALMTGMRSGEIIFSHGGRWIYRPELSPSGRR